MQRTIDVFGCSFDVDYEWDDDILCLEGVFIDGNDLTDLINQKVTDKIEESLHEAYGEDMACMAEYRSEMRRAA